MLTKTVIVNLLTDGVTLRIESELTSNNFADIIKRVKEITEPHVRPNTRLLSIYFYDEETR